MLIRARYACEIWGTDEGCVDLFARLRELRGNKTMVFSSHRFGNLTRHADLILCVSAIASVSVSVISC